MVKILFLICAFNFDLDTYRFPPDLDIDLIEHVERAKLFTKRYIPPPNKGRKKKAEEEVVGDETADGDTSDQNENETQIVHKKKKKSSKRRSHNSQEKSLNKEKEGLRIKSAQVNLFYNGLIGSLYWTLLMMKMMKPFLKQRQLYV
jgi:hypothetical protein